LRVILLIQLFLAVVFSAQGQLLNPPETKLLTPFRKFNSVFIAENAIKEIRIKEELKPDGDKIKPTGFEEVYRFDPSGRLNSVSQILASGDTLTTTFTYSGNRLECEIKNDAAGMFSYCYTYGNDGKPASIKYARLRSDGSEATKINTESFTHKSYPGQLHSTLYNGSGRPYRKEIRYFDENGYMVRYLKSFVMTSKREEEEYTYDDHGFLANKSVLEGENEYSLSYEYDEFGNLQAAEKWKDEKKAWRKEYVYRSEDMLVKAELQRDEQLQAIRISGYDYSFYR